MSMQDVVRAKTRGATRRRIRGSIYMGAALVPLLGMGVTLPSAVGLSSAVAECERQQVRLSRRSQVAAEVEGLGSEAELMQIQRLSEAVRALVPTSVGPLQEFGAMRLAAERNGIHLDSIRLLRDSVPVEAERRDEDVVADPMDTMDSMDPAGGPSGAAAPVQPSGPALVMDEIELGFQSHPARVPALVAALRSAGLPTTVLELSLNRDQIETPTFQIELRLGVLRRAQPKAALPLSSQ